MQLYLYLIHASHSSGIKPTLVTQAHLPSRMAVGKVRITPYLRTLAVGTPLFLLRSTVRQYASAWYGTPFLL